jgi:hypothetical protein
LARIEHYLGREAGLAQEGFELVETIDEFFTGRPRPAHNMFERVMEDTTGGRSCTARFGTKDTFQINHMVPGGEAADESTETIGASLLHTPDLPVLGLPSTVQNARLPYAGDVMAQKRHIQYYADAGFGAAFFFDVTATEMVDDATIEPPEGLKQILRITNKRLNPDLNELDLEAAVLEITPVRLLREPARLLSSSELRRLGSEVASASELECACGQELDFASIMSQDDDSDFSQ